MTIDQKLYVPAWLLEAGPHVERAEVFVNPRDVARLVRVYAQSEVEAAGAAERALATGLLQALQPFVTRNSSEETITITVRTVDVERARAAIARAIEG